MKVIVRFLLVFGLKPVFRGKANVIVFLFYFQAGITCQVSRGEAQHCLYGLRWGSRSSPHCWCVCLWFWVWSLVSDIDVLLIFGLKGFHIWIIFSLLSTVFVIRITNCLFATTLVFSYVRWITKVSVHNFCETFCTTVRKSLKYKYLISHILVGLMSHLMHHLCTACMWNLWMLSNYPIA